MAFDPLSPEVTYALKQNIKYPGTSAQATAAITAAQNRMQDAYANTTPPDELGYSVKSRRMYRSSLPPRHVRHGPLTALTIPMVALTPESSERATAKMRLPGTGSPVALGGG